MSSCDGSLSAYAEQGMFYAGCNSRPLMFHYDINIFIDSEYNLKKVVNKIYETMATTRRTGEHLPDHKVSVK